LGQIRHPVEQRPAAHVSQRGAGEVHELGMDVVRRNGSADTVQPGRGAITIPHVYGSTLPGFMMPNGSSAALIRCITANSAPPRQSGIMYGFSLPMPCSAEKLPSSARTTSFTVSMIA